MNIYDELLIIIVRSSSLIKKIYIYSNNKTMGSLFNLSCSINLELNNMRKRF